MCIWEKRDNGGITCVVQIAELMPIYEYKCSGCSKVVERIVSGFRASDEDVFEKCADCGGELRRVVTNCTFKPFSW
jgi:putative FmdB family regulatory protein